MTCPHTQLVLLPRSAQRMRCRHCHLTIKADELGSGYCPECFETEGRKRYDFEEIRTEETPRYRCEQCGAVIDADDTDDVP